MQSSLSAARFLTLETVQNTASGCCDFLAQCILVCINHCTYHLFNLPKFSKIYRCWIIWGQNIRVVIIPSFLAVAYLGQSIYFCLMSQSQFIVSSYLASATFEGYLYPDDYNKFHRNDGREWPGDGIDSVQDPQGVLES